MLIDGTGARVERYRAVAFHDALWSLAMNDEERQAREFLAAVGLNVDTRTPGAAQRRRAARRHVPSETRGAVYRHYDASGVLLYVGMTVNFRERTHDHLMAEVWSQYAATGTVVWYDSAHLARIAEREAIKAESPVFNTYHADPGRARRAREYVEVLAA